MDGSSTEWMKEAWAMHKNREDVIRVTKRPDTVLNALQSILSDINIFNTADLALSLVRRKPLLKKMNITACLVFARSHVTNLKAIRRKLWSEDTNINLNVLNVWYNPNAVIPTIMLGGCFAAGWIAKQFEALWFMKWDINILEWLFWFISVLKLWYWRENVSKWKLVKPLVVKGYYMSPVKE